MCGLGILVAVALAGQASQPAPKSVKDRLKSDNYTVTWGAVPNFDAGGVLEIGSGAGHGGVMEWLRFQPHPDRVDVLWIKFDEGWVPYESKWPPDHAPVTIWLASMKPAAYTSLLRDFATISSAELKRVPSGSIGISTQDFWAYARLAAKDKTLLSLDWAGYYSTADEAEFAKPHLCGALADEAAKGLIFKRHELTAAERAWASEKFARDWKTFKQQGSHWWVQERYLVTIGVVGDAAALPLLREIIVGDPVKPREKQEPPDRAEARKVYYAINAVTRLTKKDVRGKPVEEMDIERVRPKVLELLRDKK